MNFPSFLFRLLASVFCLRASGFCLLPFCRPRGSRIDIGKNRRLNLGGTIDQLGSDDRPPVCHFGINWDYDGPPTRSELARVQTQVAGHLRQVFHRFVIENLSAIAEECKPGGETRVRENSIEGCLPVGKREGIGGCEINQRSAYVNLILKRHHGHRAGTPVPEIPVTRPYRSIGTAPPVRSTPHATFGTAARLSHFHELAVQ